MLFISISFLSYVIARRVLLRSNLLIHLGIASSLTCTCVQAQVSFLAMTFVFWIAYSLRVRMANENPLSSPSLQIAPAVLSTIDLRRAPHALIHQMGDSPHKTKSPAELQESCFVGRMDCNELFSFSCLSRRDWELNPAPIALLATGIIGLKPTPHGRHGRLVVLII
ncbi:MAG TPA: hypothetical protein VIN60_08480 [Anaerolineales bacterium]